MSRRLGVGLILAVVLLLGLSMPALAGGVVVTLDGMPTDIQPNTPFQVGFKILSMHDSSPQSGFEPTVTATNPATGERVSVTATHEGAAGHYVATLILPSQGQWAWEIQPLGQHAENYPPSVMTPLQVGAAAPAQPLAPAQPAQPQGTSLSPVLLPALAAAGLLAALAVRARIRRRSVA